MESFLKRRQEALDNKNKRSKPSPEKCPHAEKCYRKNPHHFREYDHPHLTKLLEMKEIVIPDSFPQDKKTYLEQLDVLRPLLQSQTAADNIVSSKTVVNNMSSSLQNSSSPSCSKTSSLASSSSSSSSVKVAKRSESSTSSTSSAQQHQQQQAKAGTMLDKLQKAAPYNLFFTTIPKSAETLKQQNAVTFTDLLCPSLGTLKCSLQINFMIDIMWLMEQYQARNLNKKPLTILYGSDDFPKMEEYMDRFLPNVTYHYVKVKDPFGCHHSKIGIYLYEDDSLRIVVSSANLYYEDWNHYNQGLWMSPACKRLPKDSPSDDGESPTGFKTSLLNYLRSYNLPCLEEWIEHVKRADFSDVRVFLVASVPGKHYPKTTGSHVHRVADLLSRHCTLPQKTTPESEGPLSWGVIAQASSIGSLGKSPAEWLRGTLLRSLAAHNKAALVSNPSATLSVVFPSVDNVMKGHFGAESGGCLPYSKQTNEKQRWLQDYLHQWKADRLHRSRAMPHIKTYCRVSPCLTKLAWFLLTSANISKSAWGGNIQKDQGIHVRSYECGVMFLPKFFDEEYFEIARTVQGGKNAKEFPFMYDLPLTSYKSDDYPWCN